jgi:endonuclease G
MHWEGIMARNKVKLILILCIFTLVPLIFGDYLEVRRDANIKSLPDKDSETRERVIKGQYLVLPDNYQKVNGWWETRTSENQIGWVYQTFVRPGCGHPPVPASEAQVANPLADPTITITSIQREYATRHLQLGKPQAVYERIREGYVLGYDGRLKIPLWVQYQLRPEDLEGPAERTNDFREDVTIPVDFRSKPEDYEVSDYVQGHMAPAADMERSWAAMSESFLLTNMAPQVGQRFNSAVWMRLEGAVRRWVSERGALTIITGPIFSIDNNGIRYELIGNNHVAVPSHFYKIVVDANNQNNVRALAFVIANIEHPDGTRYEDFLISIDDIEKMTGLNFLSALPVDVQEGVETSAAPGIW